MYLNVSMLGAYRSTHFDIIPLSWPQLSQTKHLSPPMQSIANICVSCHARYHKLNMQNVIKLNFLQTIYSP